MTTSRPRVAVYNRYWASRGGGERHSGMVAQVLAKAGADVELVGHGDDDIDELAEYLGLDLSGCSMRVVPDLGDATLSVISHEYDLFVNGSYMSRMQSQAAKSIYLCYFPTPADHDLEAWRRAAIRTVGRLAKPLDNASFAWGTGWFPADGGRRRRWIWTNGEAHLQFAPGAELTMRFDLARLSGEPTALSVTMNDRELVRIDAGPRFVHREVRVPAAVVPRAVTFRSATFTPGAPDLRQLGVAVSRIRFAGAGIRPRERLALRFPWLLRDPSDLDYLATYDVVLANSQYTADWISRLWNHSAEVIYPPIQVDRFHPAAERSKTIVAVGRFFAPGHGHSKRQLELVQAFERIQRARQLPDWTLHLVGGCEPTQRPYLDAVRAAAAGLPVEIHANASRAVVEELMSTASLQWAATGYGEDDAKAPWASEHFGMTTVEAMAGGCVPIVIDKAGQKEIVRDGVDGYRWNTLDQLTQRTLQVAGDEALRARLAASARERAQLYSDAAFADNVLDLVKHHDLL